MYKKFFLVLSFGVISTVTQASRPAIQSMPDFWSKELNPQELRSVDDDELESIWGDLDEQSIRSAQRLECTKQMMTCGCCWTCMGVFCYTISPFNMPIYPVLLPAVVSVVASLVEDGQTASHTELLQQKQLIDWEKLRRTQDSAMSVRVWQPETKNKIE